MFTMRATVALDKISLFGRIIKDNVEYSVLYPAAVLQDKISGIELPKMFKKEAKQEEKTAEAPAEESKTEEVKQEEKTEDTPAEEPKTDEPKQEEKTAEAPAKESKTEEPKQEEKASNLENGVIYGPDFSDCIIKDDEVEKLKSESEK